MKLRELIVGAAVAVYFVSCTSAPPTEPAKKKEPGAYRIYVTNESSGDLTVIDSAEHEVIATVKLGKRPRGVHASPDGKTIYVALSGSPIAPPGVDESTLPPPDRGADGIGVVDVKELKLVKIIRAGQDPEQFDLSKDGKFLYVSNEDDAKTSVVDLATENVVATVKVGEEPEGVTLSPDGKQVWVTAENDGTVTVIDTASNKAVKTIKVGRRPRTVMFLTKSPKAYVTMENEAAVAVADTAKLTAGKPVNLGDKAVKPMGLALSADESKLFVSTGRFHKVFVIDTATDTIADSFEAGERPWGIGLSPDGKTIYTANGPSGDVSVIDVATKAVTRKVKAGDRPWGILVLPTPR